jgi:3-methyladenine DNA glycosylase/8-oxoguanine DNA glycosylase
VPRRTGYIPGTHLARTGARGVSAAAPPAPPVIIARREPSTSTSQVTRLVELRPRGPYSLALTARLASDATRHFRDGVLTSLLEGNDGLEVTRAWQKTDGSIVVHATTDRGVETTRFVLGIDDDHTEFLRRFCDDPLLGRALRHLRGLRVARVPTVAGALLRALCGQLIDSKRARQIERAVIRATSERFDGLAVPPTAASLSVPSPARLRELGLHARRGATLARLCAALDLERLRTVPIDRAAARLARERGLGRWSVGVVALHGLGSYQYGLAGDLGLLKLFDALHGRWPEEGEDAALLAPYEEWQGLASVYLLAGWARGLVPVDRRAAA